MKLRLLAIGRLAPELQAGVEDYLRRIRRHLPVEVVELKEEPPGRKPDPAVIRRREGERLAARLPAAGAVLVLDERGRGLTSEQFAALLERHMVQGTPELTFVIGGAYGLTEEMRQRADGLLSLSTLTFTHQMARLFLAEQIYRGLSIIRGEPYHNA